jgi:ArsR family transcriptional regulator
MDKRTAEVGEMLKALSEPTRYKIITLLLRRHHCSRSLAKSLGISESAVSQHMSVLKKAGLVTSFRHGYHIHYVINEDAITEIADEMARWKEMMRNVRECHAADSCCRWQLDDGSNGCLYKSIPEETADQ